MSRLCAWTDAVVVWDSGSEDGTQDRARAAGAAGAASFRRLRPPTTGRAR
ncbi:MAG: hypothetical protein R2856_27260 [Caldilineaceae bacterium]